MKISTSIKICTITYSNSYTSRTKADKQIMSGVTGEDLGGGGGGGGFGGSSPLLPFLDLEHGVYSL